MKKIILLIVTCASLMISCSAFAADVSAYEGHATINLGPFKSDFYEGTFDNMSYEATITAAQKINMEMKNERLPEYPDKFTFSMRIDMKTLLGVESFSPSFAFRTLDYSSVGGFYCVIGENRYLLSAEIDYESSSLCEGHIIIGKNFYNVLKEISTTSYDVKFCTGGNTSYIYKLTDADKSVITQFLWDMDYSGLTSQLVDDTVLIITQYN